MCIDINTKIKNANKEEILSLLGDARVSVGHFNGRHLTVPGYNGQTTFSKFHERIETLYQESLKPMHDRQNNYNKNSTSSMKAMPAPGLLGLILFPIVAPVKLVADALCWASTPYPEVSEAEEQQFSDVLQWREMVDSKFNSLTEESQKAVNKLATSSFRGKIIKCWDSFLDTEKACQNPHRNDRKTLNMMVETRKKKTQSAIEQLAAIAKTGQQVYELSCVAIDLIEKKRVEEN